MKPRRSCRSPGTRRTTAVIWVSDKVWSSLSDEEKGYVQAAADEVSKNEPAKAIALERESIARLKKIGVKFFENVDKCGFIAASRTPSTTSSPSSSAHMR